MEQYRFLWLPTFQRPIAIRIQRDSSQATLRVVRLSGAGGYEPGHMITTALFRSWRTGIDSSLRTKASFWSMATKENYPGDMTAIGGFWRGSHEARIMSSIGGHPNAKLTNDSWSLSLPAVAIS